MTHKELQAYTAAAIFAVIAFFLLGCASVAAWGMPQPHAAPELVLICGLFTLAGIPAAWAAIFAARSAEGE